MPVFRNTLVVALAAVLVVGPQLLGAQTAAGAASVTMLAPGDAVRIAVWRQPELSGEFAIAEDGTITHPLLNQVIVVGVPISTARQRVRDFLARLESNPQFVVEPLLRVSVGGEVRQPNLFRLTPETTVAQAVAAAGGVTERGRLDKIRLFRGGQEQMIDLTHPEAGLAQSPIRSGDQIFVERRTMLFRDYIAPAGSIAAALVALLNFLVNN